MTTRYLYAQRPIGTCRAQRAARAADTARSVSNASALYERPLLAHSGPTPMRMGESLDQPYPWPWVRLDTASGVPTRLDEATIYLRHTRGSLDVSLRLIGLTHVEPEVSEDPAKLPSSMPCLLKAELLQYVAGSTTPTLIAETERSVDIICIPDPVTPWYPLVSLLSMGWAAGLGGYNKDLQTISGGGVLRVGQLYPPDLALLLRQRITIDFGDEGWTPDFDAWRQYPSFVRVTLIKDPARSPVWDPEATQDLEFVRIFCVGSEMRERGR